MDKQQLSSTRNDTHRNYDQQEPILANSIKENATTIITKFLTIIEYSVAFYKQRIIDDVI